MHVIGTAGHVDHGKSTLIEKLTGIDPDRFAEEKRRGLTIDLGFAWLTTPAGREVGIIDVPGHERFIKNMLAGAGGITVVLFVVAANEGWMPQSTEHLAILDILGIDHGVVALTKADLVDEETLELAIADTEERIQGTSLEGARVVPVSATTGRGLEELVKELDRVLDSAPAPEDRSRPRLWIDRVFTISGAGTVVTGTLAGGTLRPAETVEVAPGGQRGRIRTVQSHKKQIEEVEPGNRVALNLAGLDRTGTERGDAVVLPGQWTSTSRLDALLKVLPRSVSGVEHELTEKGAHLLYVGSAETPVRISLLDKDAIGPGEQGFARLWLRDPLPLTREDRFVLRDAGRVLTFGGGKVLDPLAPSERVRDRPQRVALLRELSDATPKQALNAIVGAEGDVPVAEALTRSGAAHASDEVTQLGDYFVSQDRLSSLEEELRDQLAAWHAAHPLEGGMQREALRAALHIEPDSFSDLLARARDVAEDGSRVRLASFAVELDPKQQRARDDTLRAIESAGFTPPLRAEVDAAPELLRSLTEAGDLVAVGDFFLTASQARDARDRIRSHIQSEGPATVAQIRDLLGTTRKYAVPLCEWLDQTGATRRQGDVRVLGPNP
ncbi:MAG TPA: selenocysteine-specific translation elongation factor [Actinomycetota bacterium]|nr:selenocysteine-specific translation elongation factor [Actinomycetota bacterium]